MEYFLVGNHKDNLSHYELPATVLFTGDKVLETFMPAAVGTNSFH